MGPIRKILKRVTATGASGRRWWYVFVLWMVVPAAILGLFALRTVRLLQVEGQQKAADERQQAARVADGLVSAVLDEAGEHSEASPFAIEPGNLAVFPRDRLYFGEFGNRPANAPLRISIQAQEMAEHVRAEESAPARESLYQNIARTESALADWTGWARSRKAASRDWSNSDGLTPSGLPLALIAAETSGETRVARAALDRLRSGQWWMSYEERAFHDDELTKLLREAGEVVRGDERLAELALAEQLLRLALPRLQSGERRVFLVRGGRGILFLARSGEQMAGTALGTANLQRLVDSAMRAATPAAALRNGPEGPVIWAATGVARPLIASYPLSAVAGWQVAFSEAEGVTAAGRQQWIWYGFVGLLFMMLGSGVIMTGKVVRREMELSQHQADFVAAVTHELKSPITSIRLLLERLTGQRVTGTEAAAAYYSAIEGETVRLERLVNRVLDSQKFRAGKMTYSMGPCALESLASKSVERFLAQAEARGVTLRLRSAEKVTITGDAIALAEAIDNLIDNAIRYSGPESETLVAIRREVDIAVVEVRDQGIGIDPDDMPRLFDPFFRGRRGDKYNVRGTGLGLALVKAAAHAHGGSAEVSAGDGGGSVFRLKLPLKQTAKGGADE